MLLSASPEGRGTNTRISDPFLFDILYKVFLPFPLCCQLCFSISPNTFWPHFNISQNVLGLVLIFSSPAETRVLPLCWCSGLSAFSVSFSKWCLCMGASYLPSPKALFVPSPHSPVQGALVPQGCSSRGCGFYSQGCQGGDTAQVGTWRRDKWCHLLNDVKLMSSILIHQAGTSPISQCHSQLPPVPVTSPGCLSPPIPVCCCRWKSQISKSRGSTWRSLCWTWTPPGHGKKQLQSCFIKQKNSQVMGSAREGTSHSPGTTAPLGQ